MKRNTINSFRSWRRSIPQKIGLRLAYDNTLAHKIEAGSDMFLMPSRYEPCGLNQIYSLKYGTIPIVRATGGLDDTIQPFKAQDQSGTGFKFQEYQAEAFWQSLEEALQTYKNPTSLAGADAQCHDPGFLLGEFSPRIPAPVSNGPGSSNRLRKMVLKVFFRSRPWIGALILILVYGLGVGLSRAGPPDREWESGSVNLNLTDDQAQAFQELRHRFRQELIQVRKKMAGKRLELRTLSEEEFQGLRGEEIRRDLQALFLNGRERALVYQSEALKILRADQKEKLPAGSDLGFRCHWGSLMGGGPGRDFRRNRNHACAAVGEPPSQP